MAPASQHHSDSRFEACVASPHPIREFFDARQQALSDPETYQRVRQALLAGDRQETLALFEAHLQLPDEEERARAIEGLALLYGREATDTILRRITDESPVVRWMVCGFLHDYGDLRAVSSLLDRLKNDPDAQVRGDAAAALGQIGALDALADLHQASLTDREVDPLGHSPASQALDAMTSILRDWVSRQIQGNPPGSFSEATTRGTLRATVTAEAIGLEPEGGLRHTMRYAHLPASSFGHGWTSWLDLQTGLIDPFEIEVEYDDPDCVIRRILVYQQIPDDAKFNWAVHAIVDPAAMKSPSPP